MVMQIIYWIQGFRGPLIIYDQNDPHRRLYDVDDVNTVCRLVLLDLPGELNAIFRSLKLETGGSSPRLHCSTATLLLVLFPSLTVAPSMVLAVSKEDLKFLGLSLMSSRANAIVSVSSTSPLVMSSPSPLTITIWVSIYCSCVPACRLMEDSSCYCGRWHQYPTQDRQICWDACRTTLWCCCTSLV